MEQILNVNDLLKQQVRSILDGEKHILHIMPRIKARATERELILFLDAQTEEKERQMERLIEICDILEVNIKGEKNEGVRALSRQKKALLDRSQYGLLDDAIISIYVRSIVDLQISAYHTAINCTVELSDNNVIRLLRKNLREEKSIERKLSILEEVLIEDVAVMPIF